MDKFASLFYLTIAPCFPRYCIKVWHCPVLDSVSKWKKEREGGGTCVLSGYCDGDEHLINAIVIIMIMSLSEEEETLKKGGKDLGLKLRG